MCLGLQSSPAETLVDAKFLGIVMVVKSLLNRFGRAYINRICRAEFRSQSFKRVNERPVEFSFVFRKLAELNPRTVLDVGTGKTALPHMMRNCGFLVTATDNVIDYWPRGMMNRHYHVIHDDITHTKLTETFDVLTCISVLEHIAQSDQAVASMLSLLNPGGHLLLSFPYCESEHIDNVYELPGSSYGQGASYKTSAYSRADLDRWFRPRETEIVEQEYWQYWDGLHWTVGNQVLPPRKSTADTLHQHTCLHVKRLPADI